MHRPRGANTLLILLLLVLAAILGVLATLQYRWIDRVSSAERINMRENLTFAARTFAAELRRELEPIPNAFERGEDIMAARPDLVEAVYVVEPGNEEWLLRGPEGVVPWPPAFERLHGELDEMLTRGRFEMVRPPGPFQPGIPALFLIGRGGIFGNLGRPTLALVQLDRAALHDQLLPRLLREHFTLEYDVAIASGRNFVYRSSSTWPDGSTPPDVELALEPVAARGGSPGPRPPDARPDDPRRPNPERWRLLVRRRDGGVDAAIAAARRRNLAVSFGIMLILGTAVLLLVALLRRAERLRQQQIEFVAAISHELNTPVAALRSAGENLRDGIIAEPERIRRYGESIVRESTRLGELVGQVLELAGMRARRARPHERLDVAAILDEAIAQSRWIAQGKALEIETHVEADLPAIEGDRNAFMRAIQNLIANAIRHGGSGGWIGVQAARDGNDLRITVEDRGPGIDASEAARLFEPFYRGRKSASTPGAGLGLAIVRQIAIEHHGSVQVEKRRSGAAFTMRVPHV